MKIPTTRIAPTIRRAGKGRFTRLGSLLIAGCFLTSGNPLITGKPVPESLSRFTFIEYHMGVDARLVVYAPNLATATTACSAAFERIAELDSMMSDYRRDSELTRLGERSGGPPVHVSPDLFKVLKRAQEFSRISGGAFDVTVGPLVQLWRKARKTRMLPSATEIERARKLVGWKKMRLDPREHTVRLTVAGMRLDLGGIAKGYADDEAQITLKRHGISRALVEMGGDIVVSGPPPGTNGWKIQVPNAGNGPRPVTVYLANRAISTSGDTEQFVVIGGVRYSHVIDPRTGWALTNRIQGTVIAPDGLTSDPLSKFFALLSKRDCGRIFKAFPGTKSYVRSLK